MILNKCFHVCWPILCLVFQNVCYTHLLTFQLHHFAFLLQIVDAAHVFHVLILYQTSRLKASLPIM